MKEYLIMGAVAAGLLGLNSVATILANIWANSIVAPLKIAILILGVLGFTVSLPSPLNIILSAAFIVLLGALTAGIGYLILSFSADVY